MFNYKTSLTTILFVFCGVEAHQIDNWRDATKTALQIEQGYCTQRNGIHYAMPRNSICGLYKSY